MTLITSATVKGEDMPDEAKEEGPVEAAALSQMGSTFAERKAAREKQESKAVQPEGAENKAVAKKAASKK